MTRVLVTGSRDYDDQEYLWVMLDEYHKEHNIELIIEGGARGADLMARNWAYHNRIPWVTFPAKWHKYGIAAGPLRNKEMLEMGEPDVVLAFPLWTLDLTIGTKNMVKQAQKAKVLTIVYEKGT